MEILLGLIGGLGTTEVMLVIFVMLLFFGGKRIPELARGLGKGIREFNNARANIETEIKDGIRDAERTEAAKKVD
jgi:sec-independent protein translocase protein TatA